MPESEEERSDDFNVILARVIGFGTRRWAWILVPACLVTLGTVGALWMLPNLYTSEARLVVVEQQVPMRYVVPNSTTDLSSALEAMKQEVLSRTQILKMITDFGLYVKEKKRLAPERLVALMLANLDIVPLGRAQQKDFDAFKISFTNEDPLLAQQITNTLTSLFIGQHLRSRENQSSNTTNFLRGQLEGKKKQLDEQEQRLRDFKMQHIGELPEQQQGNLGILSGLHAQLQNTMTALDRAQQQRVYLQSLIDAYERQSAASRANAALFAGMPAVPRNFRAVESVQNELTRLELARAALLKTYTLEHPDVVKNQAEIAAAEDALKRLEASSANAEQRRSPAVSQESMQPMSSPAERAEEAVVAQFKSQLRANQLEMENLSKDEKQLKAAIAQYESRLNQTPVREQQQAGILRETEGLRQEYADLQKKEQESELATNLEKQQGGQQFRVVDYASFPIVPSSPKRLKLSISGAAVGLLLGLALAFLMEKRDTSFHTENDLLERVAPCFVFAIPLLATTAEQHRQRWKNTFQFLAGSVLALTAIVAVVYTYKFG